MKEIFLENLPKYNDGRISWTQCKNVFIDFIYNDIFGKIKILQYLKYNRKLEVEYLDKIYYISPSNLIKVRLGGILGLKTSELRIKINSIFKDKNRDITIIGIVDEFISTTRKNYKYKCNICGFNNGILSEYSILKGTGCSCCKSLTVVKGINDLNTTHPDLIKYLNNIEDGEKVSSGSHKLIELKCINCNNIYKIPTKRFVYNINKNTCKKCSDGVSYPNKFIFNMLEQLNVEFKPEMTFNWSENKRYDFYIPKFNCIIEAHGTQHYRQSFKDMSLEFVKNNDNFKRNLANINNIKYYIEIDCQKSNLEYIKNNILNSKLNKLFDLSNVDWIKCSEMSNISLLKTICEHKRDNPDITTVELSKIYKMSRDSIAIYLKEGNKIWDWADYDPISDRKKYLTKISKPIEVFKDNMSLGIFESLRDLENKSVEKFGIRLCDSTVGIYVIKNKSYKGFTFKYI